MITHIGQAQHGLESTPVLISVIVLLVCMFGVFLSSLSLSPRRNYNVAAWFAVMLIALGAILIFSRA